MGAKARLVSTEIKMNLRPVEVWYCKHCDVLSARTLPVSLTNQARMANTYMRCEGCGGTMSERQMLIFANNVVKIAWALLAGLMALGCGFMAASSPSRFWFGILGIFIFGWSCIVALQSPTVASLRKRALSIGEPRED